MHQYLCPNNISLHVRTSLVLVLCNEYTVVACLMAIETNCESIPVFLVPKGGFMITVSKPENQKDGHGSRGIHSEDGDKSNEEKMKSKVEERMATYS